MIDKPIYNDSRTKPRVVILLNLYGNFFLSKFYSYMLHAYIITYRHMPVAPVSAAFPRAQGSGGPDPGSTWCPPRPVGPDFDNDAALFHMRKRPGQTLNTSSPSRQAASRCVNRPPCTAHEFGRAGVVVLARAARAAYTCAGTHSSPVWTRGGADKELVH